VSSGYTLFAYGTLVVFCGLRVNIVIKYENVPSALNYVINEIV